MSEPSDPKEGEADRRAEVVRASSQYLGHGLGLAASVAFFGWIGWWVGARLGAQPLLTLLGMMLGGAAGFYSIYAQLVIRPREEAERASGGSEEK